MFHIAERHAGLLGDANAGARAIAWMFAALNTVEAPILDLQTTKFMERDKTWYEERLPIVEDRIRDRLGELSDRLGNADWLDGAFSAGDLMMVAVLLRLKVSGLLDEYPNLAAYVARGEARPAYKRAFASSNWRFFVAGRCRSPDEGQLTELRRHHQGLRPARADTSRGIASWTRISTAHRSLRS